MDNSRSPTDCKHFPLCESLKTLTGKLSLKLLDTYTGILIREARQICSQCNDYEHRETLGEMY